MRPPLLPIVVMGVSGAGKSTVGAVMSAELGLVFAGGDDLHSVASKSKMAGGVSLSDDDRWLWLARVGETLRSGAAEVVACSALKRVHRDAIRAIIPEVYFVWLDGEAGMIVERLGLRSHEYMAPTLRGSQVRLLEPLGRDECGIRILASLPVAEIVGIARRDLTSTLE
jgi:gluconokinase